MKIERLRKEPPVLTRREQLGAKTAKQELESEPVEEVEEEGQDAEPDDEEEGSSKAKPGRPKAKAKAKGKAKAKAKAKGKAKAKAKAKGKAKAKRGAKASMANAGEDGEEEMPEADEEIEPPQIMTRKKGKQAQQAQKRKAGKEPGATPPAGKKKQTSDTDEVDECLVEEILDYMKTFHGLKFHDAKQKVMDEKQEYDGNFGFNLYWSRPAVGLKVFLPADTAPTKEVGYFQFRDPKQDWSVNIACGLACANVLAPWS